MGKTNFRSARGMQKFNAFFTALFFTLFNTLQIVPPAQASVSPIPLAGGISGQSLPQDLGQLGLPAELGIIQEAFRGSSDQAVIYIQDAHTIYEAQKSIQGLINHFQKNYGITSVALEGGSGKLDPFLFRQFPNKNQLKEVLDSYLQKGELSGAVSAAVLNEKEADYSGIENQEFYESAIAAYLEAQKAKPEFLTQIQKIRDEVTAAKKKIYPSKLLELDRALEGFWEGKSELVELLKMLLAIQKPADYPHVEAVAKDLEENPEVFQREIENQIKTLSVEVKRLLKAKKEISAFNEKHQSYVTSQLDAKGFAHYLLDRAREKELETAKYSALHKISENYAFLRQMQGPEFFGELENYIQDVKSSLFPSREAGLLDELDGRLRLLTRLANLELSREDWNRFQSEREKFKPWVFEGFLRTVSGTDPHPTPLPQRGRGQGEGEARFGTFSNLKVSSFQGNTQNDFPLAAHARFYDLALKRDAAMFENLRATSPERRATILITGGFHTQGLTESFRKAGISYALIAPRISKMPEENLYSRIMSGDVSWKNYFEVKNWKVNLYDAFARATVERLMQKLEVGSSKFEEAVGSNRAFQPPTSNFQLVKQWRDSILRNLSKEGRIENAADYTRFIDESAVKSISPDELAALQAQWRSRIEKFLSGLEDLIIHDKVTEENLAQLFKQPTAVPPATMPLIRTAAGYPSELFGLGKRGESSGNQGSGLFTEETVEGKTSRSEIRSKDSDMVDQADRLKILLEGEGDLSDDEIVRANELSNFAHRARSFRFFYLMPTIVSSVSVILTIFLTQDLNFFAITLIPILSFATSLLVWRYNISYFYRELQKELPEIVAQWHHRSSVNTNHVYVGTKVGYFPRIGEKIKPDVEVVATVIQKRTTRHDVLLTLQYRLGGKEVITPGVSIGAVRLLSSPISPRSEARGREESKVKSQKVKGQHLDFRPLDLGPSSIRSEARTMEEAEREQGAEPLGEQIPKKTSLLSRRSLLRGVLNVGEYGLMTAGSILIYGLVTGKVKMERKPKRRSNEQEVWRNFPKTEEWKLLVDKKKHFEAVQKTTLMTLEWMITNGYPHPEALRVFAKQIESGRIYDINAETSPFEFDADKKEIGMDLDLLATVYASISVFESHDLFIEWTTWLNEAALGYGLFLEDETLREKFNYAERLNRFIKILPAEIEFDNVEEMLGHLTPFLEVNETVREIKEFAAFDLALYHYPQIISLELLQRFSRAGSYSRHQANAAFSRLSVGNRQIYAILSARRNDINIWLERDKPSAEIIGKILSDYAQLREGHGIHLLSMDLFIFSELMRFKKSGGREGLGPEFVNRSGASPRDFQPAAENIEPNIRSWEKPLRDFLEGIKVPDLDRKDNENKEQNEIRPEPAPHDGITLTARSEARSLVEESRLTEAGIKKTQREIARLEQKYRDLTDRTIRDKVTSQILDGGITNVRSLLDEWDNAIPETRKNIELLWAKIYEPRVVKLEHRRLVFQEELLWLEYQKEIAQLQFHTSSPGSEERQRFNQELNRLDTAIHRKNAEKVSLTDKIISTVKSPVTPSDREAPTQNPRRSEIRGEAEIIEGVNLLIERNLIRRGDWLLVVGEGASEASTEVRTRAKGFTINEVLEHRFSDWRDIETVYVRLTREEWEERGDSLFHLLFSHVEGRIFVEIEGMDFSEITLLPSNAWELLVGQLMQIDQGITVSTRQAGKQDRRIPEAFKGFYIEGQTPSALLKIRPQLQPVRAKVTPQPRLAVASRAEVRVYDAVWPIFQDNGKVSMRQLFINELTKLARLARTTATYGPKSQNKTEEVADLVDAFLVRMEAGKVDFSERNSAAIELLEEFSLLFSRFEFRRLIPIGRQPTLLHRFLNALSRSEVREDTPLRLMQELINTQETEGIRSAGRKIAERFAKSLEDRAEFDRLFTGILSEDQEILYLFSEHGIRVTRVDENGNPIRYVDGATLIRLVGLFLDREMLMDHLNPQDWERYVSNYMQLPLIPDSFRDRFNRLATVSVPLLSRSEVRDALERNIPKVIRAEAPSHQELVGLQKVLNVKPEKRQEVLTEIKGTARRLSESLPLEQLIPSTLFGRELAYAEQPEVSEAKLQSVEDLIRREAVFSTLHGLNDRSEDVPEIPSNTSLALPYELLPSDEASLVSVAKLVPEGGRFILTLDPSKGESDGPMARILRQILGPRYERNPQVPSDKGFSYASIAGEASDKNALVVLIGDTGLHVPETQKGKTPIFKIDPVLLQSLKLRDIAEILMTIGAAPEELRQFYFDQLGLNTDSATGITSVGAEFLNRLILLAQGERRVASAA